MWATEIGRNVYYQLSNDRSFFDADISVQQNPKLTGHAKIFCNSIFFTISFFSRNTNNNVTKIEIDGVPPIAVEALLEYCYKDRSDQNPTGIVPQE